jgi:hypothetical protein
MKKLTLDETWDRCLKMWRWVVAKWEPNKTIDVVRLKDAWLKEYRPKDKLRCNCYFCEYAKQRDKAQRVNEDGVCNSGWTLCPGRLVSPRFDCQNPKYDWSWYPDAFLRKVEQLNKKRLEQKKAKP